MWGRGLQARYRVKVRPAGMTAASLRSWAPRRVPSHQALMPMTTTTTTTTTTRDALESLLQSVAGGQVTPRDALARLERLEFEQVDNYALIDHHRTLRTGFPEVIFGEGKTPKQIVEIMETLAQGGHPVVMGTRIDADTARYVQERVKGTFYSPTARICALLEESTREAPTPGPGLEEVLPEPTRRGRVAVLCAGTCDLPVAEEAVLTARLYGFPVTRLYDVGVAGLHRLLSPRSRAVMREADVLIVVAGMEGALPSVVGGLVDVPVVAVPTSIGYGASFGGVTPLLTMLSSCAPGVGVVNIDNGFGAAVMACQILRTRAAIHDAGAEE